MTIIQARSKLHLGDKKCKWYEEEQRQDHRRRCSRGHWDNEDKAIRHHISSATSMFREKLKAKVLCAVTIQSQGWDDSRPVQGVVERFCQTDAHVHYPCTFFIST